VRRSVRHEKYIVETVPMKLISMVAREISGTGLLLAGFMCSEVHKVMGLPGAYGAWAHHSQHTAEESCAPQVLCGLRSLDRAVPRQGRR
jgi:hypothetical protein